MTDIKSNKVTIKDDIQQIFQFLGDFNNFEKLMPEQVINWQSTPDSCSFTIKGMTDLGMRTKEKTENSKIVWASDEKAPFKFTLESNLNDIGNRETEVEMVLHADLNPMLKMMAVRPLQNFVNILIEKLKDLREGK